MNFLGLSTNAAHDHELGFLGLSTSIIHKPEMMFLGISVDKPIICTLSTFGPSCDVAPPSIIEYQFN